MNNETYFYAQITSQNVQKLIAKNGTSIREVAKIIDVPASTLTDGLKSIKGIPIDSLVKISNYFNLTVDDLCNNHLF